MILILLSIYFLVFYNNLLWQAFDIFLKLWQSYDCKKNNYNILFENWNINKKPLNANCLLKEILHKTYLL